LKVGLPGNRARDQADLQERIRAFELVPITGKLIIGIYRIRLIYRVVVFGLIPINLSEIIGVKTAI